MGFILVDFFKLAICKDDIEVSSSTWNYSKVVIKNSVAWLYFIFTIHEPKMYVIFISIQTQYRTVPDFFVMRPMIVILAHETCWYDKLILQSFHCFHSTQESMCLAQHYNVALLIDLYMSQ